MKTRVVWTTCVAFVFGLASIATAQLKAGSPEEAAYMKIEAEQNADAKLTLLLNFEREFPQINGTVLANVFMMAMDIYSTKQDKAKVAEYGDKAIGKDPENINALLRVSRNLATERTNLPRAVQYAQKAKELVATMRKQPAPLGQTEQQYKQLLDTYATSAEQYYNYALALQGN